MIGITGTNGKSTTCKLIAHLLKKNNFSYSLGGNIAWNFTSEYPNMVKELILIDAAGYPTKSKSVPIAFEIAKINYQLANDRVNRGIINSFDLRDIEIAFLNSGISFLQSIYNLNESYLELVKITGGIIEIK